MGLVSANQQTCSRDGLCGAVCPMQIITRGQDRLPVPVAEADELCIRCGHCLAACPTSSLRHAELPLENCLPLQRQLLPDSEQTRHLLLGRRSIRTYRDQAVDREMLQELIDTARYAPTGHNSQGVRWLVLQDRTELRRLGRLTADWMEWLLHTNSGLAKSMHLDRVLRRIESGEDVILRGAPALVVAFAAGQDRRAPASCTIALTYLELAAAGRGLGTCWAGYFNAAAASFPPLADALALPDGCKPFGSMMIGHPRHRYYRIPERRPAEVTWR